MAEGVFGSVTVFTRHRLGFVTIAATKISSWQMPYPTRSSGNTRTLGLYAFRKTRDNRSTSRFVFGCVHGTTGVVGIDALFQVCRETDVSLFRERFALDEVHVEHFTLPEPALLRPHLRRGFGGQEGFGLRRPKVGFGRLKVGGQPRSNLATTVLLA